MYHLKLTKGLSYIGLVTATQEKPDVYIKDESTYKKILASGYFSEAGAAPAKSDSVKPAYGGKTLDEMNTSELETFATYKNVSFKGIRKREAMIEKLREELPASDLEGIIEYGSPTMVELQK